MKIPAEEFFRFCARHVPLLRGLSEKAEEISEDAVLTLLRLHAAAPDDQPDHAWRRLKELRILLPVEPGSDIYSLAEPVRQLLSYLFDTATPATSEMIRGYVDALDGSGRKLAHAIEEDDDLVAELARQETVSTLQRLKGAVEETQASIFAEVAEFKAEQRRVSVREKFRRIVFWMDRYVDPLSAIVSVDGPLEAAFAETGRLLRLAGERALFRELGAAERTLRVLRRVERFALRSFHQCRREIHPLYESLRRASFIAEGAALALARLRRDGVRGWPEAHGFGVVTLRFQYAPSDAAISRALFRLIRTPPARPPRLRLPSVGNEPPAKRRRQWLDTLPASITPELPVADLVGWIVRRHPEKNNSDVLAGFTKLLYHRNFRGEFSGTERIRYATADGALRGFPVRLAGKEPPR